MIVLDASAAIELSCRSALGERIAKRLLGESTIHAPHLLDLEVAHVLRRQCHLGILTIKRAEQALFDYVELPIERYPHLANLSRVWELRHQFTAYDAVYLALTELLGAVLITRDRALASARLRRGRVEVV